jgi:hypothetical protein
MLEAKAIFLSRIREKNKSFSACSDGFGGEGKGNNKH